MRYCLRCYNEYVRDNDKELLTEKDVVLKLHLCGYCDKVVPCVAKVKPRGYHKVYGGKPIKWYEFWRRRYPK